MKLALYQPEIAQNTGTLIRLGACLGFSIEIIEPCGFIMNDKKMKRSGMDYLEKVEIVRHISWDAFKAAHSNSRIILLSPLANHIYTDFEFKKEDILLLGRESCGVPVEVRNNCADSVAIPMTPECRSLNVAVAGAMVVGEVLRQTSQFPGE